MTETLIKMAIYAVPTVMAFAAARCGARAWWWIGGLLVALTLNVALRVELPIGRLLIELLEGVGLEQPPRHRQTQAAAAVALIMLIGGGAAGIFFRRRLTLPLLLAGAGLTAIFAIMAIRATSLHYIDRALGRPVVLAINARQVIEGLALLAVTAGAMVQYRRSLTEQPISPSEKPTSSPHDDGGPY